MFKIVQDFFWKFWWYFIVEFSGTLASLIQFAGLKRERPTDFKQTDRNGQVAIVTGGTSGIGLHITKQLLDLGMTVIAATQDHLFQSKEIVKLKEKYGNQVKTVHIELTSLTQIEKFVHQFLALKLDLNVLVCNAGVMMPPYKLTENGFEMQLGINYLGHVHLTNMLLGKLKESGKSDNYSRIILVSSCIHSLGTFRFHDLNSRIIYSPEQAYAQSKLAIVSHAISLNERLQSEGAHVTVNSVHPGVVRSGLYRHTKWFHFSEIGKYFLQPLEMGADRVVYTVTAKELEGQGGLYLEYYEAKRPNPLALDKVVRQRLWEDTINLLNKAR